MRWIWIVPLFGLAGCAADGPPRLGPGQRDSSTLGTDFGLTPHGRMTPTPFPGNDLSSVGSTGLGSNKRGQAPRSTSEPVPFC